MNRFDVVDMAVRFVMTAEQCLYARVCVCVCVYVNGIMLKELCKQMRLLPRLKSSCNSFILFAFFIIIDNSLTVVNHIFASLCKWQLFMNSAASNYILYMYI